ncbi:MAG: phosphatidylserine decarboxylase [Eubacterium sp.]|nr:phosphatidylserine decarboxylase [Eubacterium sp.]
MNYIDLDGNLIEEKTGQDDILTFLYTNKIGRMFMRLLINPKVSRAAGRMLDTHLSAKLVDGFIKREHIDMDEYPDKAYSSFNDFFTRTISEDARPIEPDENALISPCDCRACVYPILKNSNFSIKHTEYTLRSLLHSRKLADRFQGGYLFVLRLTVSDYHRYIYAASGRQSKQYRIEGSFHTVNPIANDYLPIYKENTREYTVLHTKNFGDVLQMEVGALLVGRITNHKESCVVVRGEEKGYFEYGGSTIIVITEPGRVNPREDLLDNTANELETIVHQGQLIARSIE